jgi:phosphatidylserine decarboxylase
MIKDAYPFIIPLVALALLCAYLGLRLPAAVLLLLAGFVGFFFRNPVREIPAGVSLVVSPADGRIVRVLSLPEENGEMPGGQNISIFLSIFDVHVNRAPICGELEKVEYSAEDSRWRMLRMRRGSTSRTS